MAANFARLIPSLWFKFGFVRLWRLVPRGLRRRIVRQLVKLPARTGERLPHPHAPLMMCGFLSSPLGLGWGARLNLELAREAGVETRLFDIGHAFATGKADASPPDAKGPGTVMFSFNPGQFAYATRFLPPEILRDKYIIGYCVWELDRIPDDWLPPLSLLDELWVPTHFVKTAFENAAVTLPIRIVPHILAAPPALAPDRARFALPDDAFVVTVVASLRSSLARKNPLAAIAAFRKAFPDNENALLLLKLGDSHLEAEALATVQAHIAGDTRIRLLLDSLNDADMWTLLASSDTILSLHRSEGFGLVPAQAMLAGKPVVATGWSGNLDFMPPDSACLVPYKLIPVADPGGLYVAPDQTWADPDIDVAAGYLRDLYRDDSLRSAIGQRARESIEAYFRDSRAPIVAEMRRWTSTDTAIALENKASTMVQD